MTERDIYDKFGDLSEDELNPKVIKIFTSEMMSWLLLLNVAEVGKKKKEA